MKKLRGKETEEKEKEKEEGIGGNRKGKYSLN
jgi:hypothetical protein